MLEGGIYFGLMSGTSMDGVDGVAVEFTRDKTPAVLAAASIAFTPDLREALFALQQPGDNEIEREALAATALATCYANCCSELLRLAHLSASQVRAIGAHGQTVRHRPEKGYTRQINHPARLAELTQIDVVADFRSRDVAAGGQGAPLVPAFHAQLFRTDAHTRVICNLGGISNITILPARRSGHHTHTHASSEVYGFDCGPANVLLDHWAQQHLGTPYDKDGRFAASGKIHQPLLKVLLQEAFFTQAPPKSTGRDLFNAQWLDAKLANFPALAAHDVQATLVALTAHSIAQEIARHASDCQAIYLCGGGARNPMLINALTAALRHTQNANRPLHQTSVMTTDALGVPPQHVEALAFAWLAMCCIERIPGNLPAVTGAAGERVLGALYPR